MIKNSPDAFDSATKDKLQEKLARVVKFLADSDEHIACIVIQMIAIKYDDLFAKTFAEFCSEKSPDINEIEDLVTEEFPFNDQDFYNKT